MSNVGQKLPYRATTHAVAYQAGSSENSTTLDAHEGFGGRNGASVIDVEVN